MCCCDVRVSCDCVVSVSVGLCRQSGNDDVIAFFFFKQRTAYERPMSEGSSDVCSSDLVEPEDLLKFGLIPEFIGRVPVIATLDDLDEEIGRASCRERVCQYG